MSILWQENEDILKYALKLVEKIHYISLSTWNTEFLTDSSAQFN